MKRALLGFRTMLNHILDSKVLKSTTVSPQFTKTAEKWLRETLPRVKLSVSLTCNDKRIHTSACFISGSAVWGWYFFIPTL